MMFIDEEEIIKELQNILADSKLSKITRADIKIIYKQNNNQFVVLVSNEHEYVGFGVIENENNERELGYWSAETVPMSIGADIMYFLLIAINDNYAKISKLLCRYYNI